MNCDQLTFPCNNNNNNDKAPSSFAYKAEFIGSFECLENTQIQMLPIVIQLESALMAKIFASMKLCIPNEAHITFSLTTSLILIPPFLFSFSSSVPLALSISASFSLYTSSSRYSALSSQHLHWKAWWTKVHPWYKPPKCKYCLFGNARRQNDLHVWCMLNTINKTRAPSIHIKLKKKNLHGLQEMSHK